MDNELNAIRRINWIIMANRYSHFVIPPTKIPASDWLKKGWYIPVYLYSTEITWSVSWRLMLWSKLQGGYVSKRNSLSRCVISDTSVRYEWLCVVQAACRVTFSCIFQCVILAALCCAELIYRKGVYFNLFDLTLSICRFMSNYGWLSVWQNKYQMTRR